MRRSILVLFFALLACCLLAQSGGPESSVSQDTKVQPWGMIEQSYNTGSSTATMTFPSIVASASRNSTAYNTQNTDENIVFITKEADVLVEFSVATATFVAKRQGTYLFCVTQQWSPLGYASTCYHLLGYRLNSSDTYWVSSAQNTSGTNVWQYMSFVIRLSVGDSVQLRMFSANGTDHGQYVGNQVTVTKLS